MVGIRTERQFPDDWFTDLELAEGEEVICSFPANHTQGKRAVGGKLFVTNQRVAFTPNRMEIKMRGRGMEMALSDITSIGTVKPRIRITEIFSGAWRTRLSISRRCDDDAYFVVPKPADTANEIKLTLERLAERTNAPDALPVRSETRSLE